MRPVVLVTGAAGQLGRVLVRHLQQRADRAQFTVRGVDVHPSDVPGCDEFIALDLRRLDAAAGHLLFANVCCVFHTASIIDLAPYPPPLMVEINVNVTERLLALAQASRVGCFVYTSTIDVVCGLEPLVFADESAVYPRRPGTGYAQTKGAAERLVIAANDTKYAGGCESGNH
jgi:nucleoside-diphosphate-sugar epimerase